jgi:ribulose-phosphate 3-epimerase
MKIVPAILAPSFSEFKKQACRLEGLFDLIQIDIMDGVFVKNKSFKKIGNINSLNLNINFELHLLVEHPLRELEKWKEVKNVERVIFHIESKDNPKEVIALICSHMWKVGIAINPETTLSMVKPYLSIIDAVLFMTVYPGRQGSEFLPGMKEKIKKFTTLNHRPLCLVDGGINVKTINAVKLWGADAVSVGSAISKAVDVKKAIKKLRV